jgi:nucleotide-binding universal stress UspA family protein
MKVLIAYDGSTCSEAAVAGLSRAGMPSGGEARVLAVADVLLFSPIVGRVVDGEPFPDSLRQAPADALEAVKAALTTARSGAVRAAEALPGWSVEAIAQADSPAWGVIKECDTWQPDLVVVGSHGRGAMGRLVMGSVSHKVLTEARCNVRVARQEEGSVTRAPRFIVGVDGSRGALAAVSVAAARRWPTGTEALLVCAFESRMAHDPVTDAFVGDPAARLDHPDRFEWMQSALDRAAARLRASNPGLSIDTLLQESDPKQLLLDQARERSVDSIFVGARGLVGAKRLLMGSVSTAVAMRAHCSVEVIHSSDAVA